MNAPLPPDPLSGAAPPENPFPGLRPFEGAERHLFFGREDQIVELVIGLRKSRFLAVVGTSGSGKSSLVRAGLLPSLYGGGMRGAGARWHVALFRPGATPIRNLAAALTQVLAGLFPKSQDETLPRTNTEVTLERSSFGLVETVRQARLRPGDNLLVVVDQFEELFRFRESGLTGNADGSSAHAGVALVKLLLEATRQQTIPIFVVITMRSDFLGDCARYRDLPEAINNGQYLIPRMTRDELRSAIEGPVKVGGGAISPRLVQRLLNEVGDDPDRLPVMQHALMRTWDYWVAHRQLGEPLDLPHYRAIGGLDDALSQHADEIYAELADPEHPDQTSRRQALTKKLFQGLTEKSPDNPRGTRHPIRLSDASEVAGARQEEIKEIVEHFRAPGRSFIMPPVGEELKPDKELDISHESLMRGWSRLKGWVEEESQSHQIFRRLTEAAQLHEQGQSSLYRDPQLQIALNWRQKNQPTAAWGRRYSSRFDLAMAFLEASRAARDQELAQQEAARRQQLHRAWAAAGVLLILAVVIAGLAMVALESRKRADARFNEIVTTSIANGWRGMTNGDILDSVSWFYNVATAGLPEKAAQERQLLRLSLALQQTPNLLHVLPQSNELIQVEFSSNRKYLLTVSSFQVIVWDANTWQQRSASIKASAPDAPFENAAFSPDGRRIATAAKDALCVWDTESGTRLNARSVTNQYFFHCVFSPDARRIAAACEDGRVWVWEWSTNVVRLFEHGGKVIRVSFSKDGKYLLSAGAGSDHTAKIWALDTGDLLATLPHEGALNSALFSPDSARVITAGADRLAKIWSVGPTLTNQGIAPVLIASLQQSKEVLAAAFGPDGQTAASGDADGQVFFWEQGGRTNTLPVHLRRINSLCFSPDGTYVVTTSDDRTAALSDFQSRRPVAVLPHAANVNDARFNPAGTQLATASDDKTVKIWDLNRLRILPHGAVVRNAAFNQSGGLVVTASDDDFVRVWDVATGKLYRNRAIPVPDVTEAWFSDDNLSVISVSGDQKLTTNRWSLEDGKGLAVPAGSVHGPSAAGGPPQVTSADGRFKVTWAPNDSSAWLWDVNAGQQLVPLTHKDIIRFAAFSQDTAHLITCSRDGTARLWDLRAASATNLFLQVKRLTGKGADRAMVNSP